MITKLFALFCWVAMSVSMTYVTMIYAYGLTVRSWWWLIGMGVLGHFLFLLVGQHICADVSKKE